MKTLIGILGLIGSLCNTLIATIAWLLNGHSILTGLVWIILGSISSTICIKFIYEVRNLKLLHKKLDKITNIPYIKK